MTEIRPYYVSPADVTDREPSSGWYVSVRTEHGHEVIRGPLSAEHLDNVTHGPFSTKQQATDFGDELARTLNADLE